ncbi:MAG: hypothetical protein A3I09_03030 [Deltaproteobacteria bacterium RIFCSPLOWO2_02_FULL_47_10]|nr:MAG: hypothetical protein A3I09_03030 [Deltaproteobacteria bacterium RIFCSPLOWO2_02_FULL_47_10]
MPEKASRIAFLILLVALMAAFVAIIKPFLLPAMFALVIAVICNPIYRFFFRLFKEWRYIASLVTTFIVCLCILAPLGIVVVVVIINASQAVSYITQQLEGGQIAVAIDVINAWLTTKSVEYANLLPADFNLRTMLVGFLKSVGRIVYQYSPQVLSATANIAASLLLVIIFLFVFFADGARLYKTLLGLLPFDENHKQILANDIRLVISATFLGQIATSCAQGLLIGIGFMLAGIDNPAFWGLVAVGVTLVPVIGGPLMYVPAGIALIISGHFGKGGFILLYGVLIVSMIDNVVKPLVMRGKVNIHPVILALSLIGGGLWLGAAGIIVGPLVVVLMLACLRIYQREFV